MSDSSTDYAIELLDESSGFCDCCGETSRSVWGLVHNGDATVAAYWMHWTVGHLNEPGANLDLVLGSWGDNATPRDRVAASLLYRQSEDHPPAFMIIDATDRSVAKSGLIGSALRREDVIGTPLAEHIFGLIDAICLQDTRFF